MKTKRKKLETKIWELCKQIVRKRDGMKCFICGSKIRSKKGWHTGHCFPRSTCGLYLKYDLRNIHSSCYRCNIHLGGNGALFILRIKEVYGEEFVKKMYQDLNKIIPSKDIYEFLEQKVNEYEKIQTLSKNKLFNYTKNL